MKGIFGERTGKKHEAHRSECEDYACFFENNSVAVVACADGCSSASYAREAAVENCEIIKNIMQNDEIWKMEGDVIADYLTEKFDTNFKLRHPENRREYAATLCAAALNKKTNEAILVSVGDGAVVLFDQNDGPFVCLAPKNGLSSSQTFFTNAHKKDLRQTVKVKTTNVTNSDYKGFAVFTDGSSDLFLKYILKGSASLMEIANALARGETEGKECLDRQLSLIHDEYTTDDASIALMLMDDFIPSDKPDVKNEYENEKPMYSFILKRLSESPANAEELVKEGFCSEGKVLRTMLPLIEEGKVKLDMTSFKFTV